jgi:fused signal recognition particle receptor
MKIFSQANFDILKKSLSKTRNGVFSKISEIISSKGNVDERFFEELEEILITSDIGSNLTDKIISEAKKIISKEKDKSFDNVKSIIKDNLIKSLSTQNNFINNLILDLTIKPYVILFFGTNGSGKTTTIAKLAYKLKNAGKKIIIASGDTFRAAANDQLKKWTDSVGVDLIECNSADASAIIYDTLTKAIKENYDVVLIDTAGRLQNNKNLMLELTKIQKVINNLIPNAPHESLLVIESNAGQNTISQTKEFSKYLPMSGLILTKLDGTAKGGTIFQICIENNLPIRFIGIGEDINDLQLFDANIFVKALFE